MANENIEKARELLSEVERSLGYITGTNGPIPKDPGTRRLIEAIRLIADAVEGDQPKGDEPPSNPQVPIRVR